MGQKRRTVGTGFLPKGTNPKGSQTPHDQITDTRSNEIHFGTQGEYLNSNILPEQRLIGLNIWAINS